VKLFACRDRVGQRLNETKF